MLNLPQDIQEVILKNAHYLYYSEIVLPDMMTQSKHFRQIIDTKYKYQSVVDELKDHLPYVQGCKGLRYICDSYIKLLKESKFIFPSMLSEEYFQSVVFSYLVLDKQFADRFEPYSISLSLIERYYDESIVEYLNWVEANNFVCIEYI